MGHVVDAKFKADAAVRACGCIISSPVLPTAEILQLRANFKCDVIIVLDQERLLNEITQSLGHNKVCCCYYA